MADIQLTPEELLQQSTEMATLQTEYESLFQQVKGSLENINGSWSPNLASNFSGKITSAQNSFSSILNMFGNGANAAKSSALRFGTPSSWLNSIVDSLDGFHGDIDKIAGLSRDEVIEGIGKSENEDKAVDIGKALTTIAKSVGIGAPQGIAVTSGVTGLTQMVLDHYDWDTNKWDYEYTSPFTQNAYSEFQTCRTNGDTAGQVASASKYLLGSLADGCVTFGDALADGVTNTTGFAVESASGGLTAVRKVVGIINDTTNKEIGVVDAADKGLSFTDNCIQGVASWLKNLK